MIYQYNIKVKYIKVDNRLNNYYVRTLLVMRFIKLELLASYI